MAESWVTPCDNCGRMYNHNRLKACPACAGQAENDSEKKRIEATRPYMEAEIREGGAKKTKSDPIEVIVDLPKQADLEPYLRELIVQSQKTRRATRAVVHLLWFITSNLFLAGIWVVFGVPREPIWILINCLAWVTAGILTFVKASTEFSKSD